MLHRLRHVMVLGATLAAAACLATTSPPPGPVAGGPPPPPPTVTPAHAAHARIPTSSAALDMFGP